MKRKWRLLEHPYPRTWSRPAARQCAEELGLSDTLVGHLGDASALLADATDSLVRASKLARGRSRKRFIAIVLSLVSAAQRRVSIILDAVEPPECPF